MRILPYQLPLGCSPNGTIAPWIKDLDLSGTTKSGSISIWEPRPSQWGQAPYGELNENILGDISSIETSQWGQAKCSLNKWSFFGNSCIVVNPEPIFNDSSNPQFSGPVAVGPVGISQITGSVASSELTISGKIKVYIELISILSLSLGVINLLPIPALDGGRILFVFIEILRKGKRVSPDKERIVHSLGFALMISLLVLVTCQDISRIFDSANIVGWQRVEYNHSCENT